MKNQKIKNQFEKCFEYDLMLYKDIEMDLRKAKTPIMKKKQILRKTKNKSKKTSRLKK